MTYRKNIKKILEGLVWIASNRPGIDHYHALKVFFKADKCHLNKYGRPIFGDNYVAMDFGPVASTTYNIIKKDRLICKKEELSNIEKSLQIEQFKNRKILWALRNPDTNFFSRTDIQCLEESLENYGSMSFGQLIRDTHKDPAYKRAWERKPENSRQSKIEFEELIEENNPNREEIIEYMRSTSSGAVF